MSEEQTRPEIQKKMETILRFDVEISAKQAEVEKIQIETQARVAQLKREINERIIFRANAASELQGLLNYYVQHGQHIQSARPDVVTPGTEFGAARPDTPTTYTIRDNDAEMGEIVYRFDRSAYSNLARHVVREKPVSFAKDQTFVTRDSLREFIISLGYSYSSAVNYSRTVYIYLQKVLNWRQSNDGTLYNPNKMQIQLNP